MAYKNTLARLSEKDVVAMILLQLDKTMLNQWFGPLVRRIQSTQPDGENVAVIGDVGGMQAGLGDGQYEKLEVENYFIRNLAWNAGLQVRNIDWDHGRRDLIEQRVQDKTDLSMGHPGELLQTAIIAGDTKACMDGNYFFAADHALADGTTQSNKITFASANPSAPSAEEMSDAILEAVRALYGLKTAKGNAVNMNAMDFTVATGLSLWKPSVKAINLAQINGSSNALPALQGKQFNLASQVLPAVASTSKKFWVFRRNASPFIWQVLDEVTANVLGRNSEHAVKYGHLLFKLDGTYNMGYGAYQHAVQVEFTQAGA